MNIAILGFGVVGKGVYDIIQKDFPTWNIKYVLELDKEKYQEVKELVPSSFDTIVNDQSIDVVIELIGGKTVAYDFIKQSLLAKKHVVTANKAVISEHFEELTKLASLNNVNLLFEASVGGAIIVLDPLYKIAQHNKINHIEGIINGSTNYVLSSIFKESKSLDDALQEALQLGYIETGSTDDMDGLDLMRKINILSMISYHTYIEEDSITRIPLSSITSEMINYIQSKNWSMKYIATSHFNGEHISIDLMPTIINESDLYNQINYEDNIISLQGAYHKKQSFIGQGAGRYPTAQAVINDLHIIHSNETRNHTFTNLHTINNNQVNTYLVQTTNGFTQITDQLQQIIKRDDIICICKMKEELS